MSDHPLSKLHAKFGGNLAATLADDAGFVAAETKIRSFVIVRGLLPTGASHHAELARLFDELFADDITSLYLGAVGLHMPARMLLRRVLELGVAVVYLWDLPHEFWGWREHDRNLSFTAMLQHLSAPDYLSYIKRDNPAFDSGMVIDSAAAEKTYRILSNTVHGKIAEFDAPLPDRFNYQTEEWRSHLALVNSVSDLLVVLWKKRFSVVAAELEKRLPQLLRADQGSSK